MKILSFELKGCKRFLPNGVTYIKYTPVEVVQLIIGSNGSGKSSLLEQLTPLPAVIADFERGGFKKIEFTHRGSHYQVNNLFDTPICHEFIKDGLSLNNSRTFSEQKELVKKEFGLTPDIHSLLIGEVLFHKMGPAERRKWFTMMSPTNYQYAMSVYGQLKERYRDIQGAIKLNHSRHVLESNKLLTEEQEIEMRESVSKLREFLKFLFEVKPNTTLFEDDIKASLEELEEQLSETLGLYLKEQALYTNYEGFSSIQEIDIAIINREILIERLKNKLTTISGSLEETQSAIDVFNKTSLKELKDLDEKIVSISDDIRKDKEKIKTQLVYQFTDPQLAENAINTILPSISETMAQLVPNEDRYYCKNTLVNQGNEIDTINKRLEYLEDQEKKYSAQKKEQEYHKNHDKTQCPKCQHSWFQHYNESLLNEITNKLERIRIAQGELETKKKAAETLVADIKEYFSLYRVYVDSVKNWTILKPLWDYFQEQKTVLKYPPNVTTTLESLKLDLSILTMVRQNERLLEDCLKLKQTTDIDGKSNIDKLSQTLETLTADYSYTSEKLRHHREQLKLYQKYKNAFTGIMTHAKDLQSLKSAHEKKCNDWIELMRRDALNSCIHEVQLELSKREKQLSEVHVQRALVENIKKEIDILEEKQEVLKVMTRRLSPLDGLIAKGLLNFINAFVAQVNSFIKKVWAWPLEIIPITLEGESDVELDYKFTVNVKGTYPTPDISKTSVGMREIIDLAFRLVAMRYLDLMDFPLVLDEFARTMDSVHRKSAFNVITGLIANSSFPQIYIVSHYHDTYGAIRNADVNVLCSTNIDMPQNTVFNKNFTIQ